MKCPSEEVFVILQGLSVREIMLSGPIKVFTNS